MTAHEVFDQVSQALVESDRAERGKIFHSLDVRSGGRFFAFVRENEIVMKLPEHRVSELIASGAGRPFDARRGRPMREWICIQPDDASVCGLLIGEAQQFVASGA